MAGPERPINIDPHIPDPVAAPSATNSATALAAALANTLVALGRDEISSILRIIRDTYATLEDAQRIANQNDEHRQIIVAMLAELYTTMLALTEGAQRDEILTQLADINLLRTNLTIANEQVRRLNTVVAQLTLIERAMTGIRIADLATAQRDLITGFLAAIHGAFEHIHHDELNIAIQTHLEHIATHVRELGRIELANGLDAIVAQYRAIQDQEHVDAIARELADLETRFAGLVAPAIAGELGILHRLMTEIRDFEIRRSTQYAAIQTALRTIVDTFIQITNETRHEAMLIVLGQIGDAYSDTEQSLKHENIAGTLMALANTFNMAHITYVLRLTRDEIAFHLDVLSRLARFNNAAILEQLDLVQAAVNALHNPPHLDIGNVLAAIARLRAELERQDIASQLGAINALYSQVHNMNPVPANVLVHLNILEQIYAEIVRNQLTLGLNDVRRLYTEIVDIAQQRIIQQQIADELSSIERIWGSITTTHLLANITNIISTLAAVFHNIDIESARGLLNEQIANLLAELHRQQGIFVNATRTAEIAAQIAMLGQFQVELGANVTRENLIRILNTIAPIYNTLLSTPLLVAAVLNAIHAIREQLVLGTQEEIIAALGQIWQSYGNIQQRSILEPILYELQQHFAALQANSLRFGIAEQLGRIHGVYDTLVDIRTQFVSELDNVADLYQTLQHAATQTGVLVQIATVLEELGQHYNVFEYATLRTELVDILADLQQEFAALDPHIKIVAALEALQQHFALLNNSKPAITNELAIIQTRFDELVTEQQRSVVADVLAVIQEHFAKFTGPQQIGYLLALLQMQFAELTVSRTQYSIIDALVSIQGSFASLGGPQHQIAAALALLQMQFADLGTSAVHDQIAATLATLQIQFATIGISNATISNILATLQAQFAALGNYRQQIPVLLNIIQTQYNALNAGPQQHIMRTLMILQTQFAALGIAITPQNQIAITLAAIQSHFTDLQFMASPRGQIVTALSAIQTLFRFGATSAAAVGLLTGATGSAATLKQQITQLGQPLVSSTSFYAILGDKTLEFVMNSTAEQQRAEKGYADDGDDIKLLEALGIFAPGTKEFHGAFAHLKSMMPDFFKGIRDKCYSPLALLTSAECESAAYVVRTVLERVHMGLKKRMEAARALGIQTARDAKAVATARALLATVSP